MADASFSSSQGHSSQPSRSQGQRTRGRFDSGKWYCDCQPRLLASHLQVKRGQAENRQRWFWRCKKPRDSECGFFIWDEEAARRSGAVIQDGRQSEPETADREPGPATTATSNASLPTRSPPPPYTSRPFEPITPPSAARTASSGKRKVPWMAKDDGGALSGSPSRQKGARPQTTDDEWDISAGEEMEMERIAQSTPDMSTPKKAAKTSRTDTPNKSPSRRTPAGDGRTTQTHHGLTTPDSSNKKPSAGDNDLYDAPSPPFGSQASASSASSSSKSKQNASLFAETLMVLQRREVQLSAGVVDDLQEMLSRHEMRLRGASSGREIAQMAVQRSKARIAELEQRVSSLENQLDSSKGLIKRLREQQQ